MRRLTDIEVAIAQERIAWRLYDMWWEDLEYFEYREEVLAVLGIEDEHVLFPDDEDDEIKEEDS